MGRMDRPIDRWMDGWMDGWIASNPMQWGVDWMRWEQSRACVLMMIENALTSRAPAARAERPTSWPPSHHLITSQITRYAYACFMHVSMSWPSVGCASISHYFAFGSDITGMEIRGWEPSVGIIHVHVSVGVLVSIISCLASDEIEMGSLRDKNYTNLCFELLLI